MSLPKSKATQLSKLLSFTLRHGALEMKLPIRSDGYVNLDRILQHNKFKQLNITLSDILEVVETNEKKRFEVTDIEGVKYIRAVQGHTIKQVEDEELLTPILNASEIALAAHGTYLRHMTAIQSTGLSRMNRKHIHMASSINPGVVVSGARNSAEVFIVINVEKAIADGILFYKSKNGVILSPGKGSTGLIPPEYFSRIVHRRDLI